MTKVRAEAVLKDEANSKAPAISFEENMILLDECSFHFFTFLLLGLESDELWIRKITRKMQT